MNPLRILLIEDDIDDYMFFREAITETGVSVDLKTATRCNNILETLSLTSGQLPDIIFLDLHMPMVSGNECLRTIRQVADMNQIPVVIYSTSASSSDIEDTFASGANMYLTKPSSFQLLVRALKNILLTDWKKHTSERSRNKFVYKHSPLSQAAA